MPIEYNTLKSWRFPEVHQTYTGKDAILYALGVGYGHDPMDENQLRFVYEKNLLATPSIAIVLGYPGFWMKDPATGIDWVKSVQGEQSLVLHRQVPAAGTVVARSRVKAVIDKGQGRGAIVVVERKLFDAGTDVLLATQEISSFCRGDGGFGAGDAPSTPLPDEPDGAPDTSCDLPTLPQAALLYRLSADPNPVHVEPELARRAGFDRPILHGLCTFGVVAHAVLKSCCAYDPHRFKGLALRFSAPVFPGDTIRTDIWRRGSTVYFRARAVERDVVVVKRGVAQVE